MSSALTDLPHRRYNPLTGKWVLVSPHRMKRPWRGKVEPASAPVLASFDAECYLCPGNRRANDEQNPQYASTYAFTNDFAALLPDAPVGLHEADAQDSGPLLKYETVKGTCRVLCYSPRHDLTLARMTPAELLDVIELWTQQTRELGQTYRCVQLFENRGELMGSSMPHPHGQVWAVDALPNEIVEEDRRQKQFWEQHRQPLLVAYERLERKQRLRVVAENDTWLAVVPFWAVWPFETLLLPHRSMGYLHDLQTVERKGLADILKRLLTRYDNLFNAPFPYSMGWHTAPFVDEDVSHWQLHAHFYPPLLRSATVRKFMVGYELLGEAQRDLTPERAAEKLRSLDDTHYLENQSRDEV